MHPAETRASLRICSVWLGSYLSVYKDRNSQLWSWECTSNNVFWLGCFPNWSESSLDMWIILLSSTPALLFCDICKQCRPRSDATWCGVWSGSSMFNYRIFYEYLGKMKIIPPNTPNIGTGVVLLISVGKSIWINRVYQISCFFVRIDLIWLY